MSAAQELLCALAAAVTARDTENIGAMLAPRLHTFGIDDVPSSEITDTLERLWRAFDNLHLEVLDVVAGEDVAWARMRMTGRNTGPFQGRQATARDIDVPVMMAVAVRDARIIAHDVSVDRLALRQQLGWVGA